MRKKKRTALPRLTVLSMNARELTAFVQSVETLRLLVQDLSSIVARRKAPKKLPDVAPPPMPEAPGLFTEAPG